MRYHVRPLYANIASGKLDARREEVIAAAIAANAHDFVSRLPDGYATVVGERGCMLSAGERQRIAIARAVIRDPRILILDEATSNLDLVSEAAVRQSLQTVARGRTTFIVGHRIAMAADADRIVVLAGGAVIEAGSHRELASAGGYYAGTLESELRRFGNASVDAPAGQQPVLS